MFIVEVHATSHIGRVRKGNEDNFLVLSVSDSKRWTGSQDDSEFVIESQRLAVDDNGVIVAVSDGMGGALAGEVASTLAVETVSEQLLENDADKTLTPEEHDYFLVSKLYNATVYANYIIHNQGRTDPQYQGMGATFTGVAVSPKFADIIQVGDSRAYLVRSGKIYQVTKDQSLVQQLIDTQQISPEEAESHNLKNVILQALGAQSEIYPISARVEPHRNDVFLLCSDGLSNKVSAANMQRLVDENIDSLEQACAELIREANNNGGEDNITVILAKFTGENLPEAVGDELKLELLDLGGIDDTADHEDTAEII